jgi:hypothetical protein
VKKYKVQMKKYKVQMKKKKKIKKALKPKDFFNFLFPLVMEILFFPLDNGKIPSKKYEKKIEEKV